MTASPTGIDVRQFNWAIFEHFTTVSEPGIKIWAPGWLVTKISAFAPSDVAVFVELYDPTGGSNGMHFNVAPGGCYVADPGGAYRREVMMFGAGAQLIVEFWYPSLAGGASQQIPTPQATAVLTL